MSIISKASSTRKPPATAPPASRPAAELVGPPPADSAGADSGPPAGTGGTGSRARRWLRVLSVMGPAFIVGAWQFGPGNLLSAVQAGNGYGYSLIWVIAVSTLLMLGFTDMSVRIALSASGSLIGTVKETLGRWVGTVAGVGVFGITLMFSVGNAVGSGIGLSLLFGGSPAVWTLACTAVVAGVVFARRYYSVFERAMIGIIALMAAGFIASAVLTGPDWSAAGAGFAPTIPSGVGLLLVALVGTNFSINAAFYTGYATRERGLRRDQYRAITIADTVPGIVAPGVMTILVIVVAATAATRTGVESSSLGQLAGVLEPLAGDVGSKIFALGFFAAAFSSMVANATAGGTLLSDGLGWGNSLARPRVKALILVVLAFGLTVTLAAGGQSPVQLLILAQALTVVFAPVLGVLLLVLANHKGLMGDLRNKPWQNVIGVLGLVAILATCYRLVVGILGG
ncbi:Nramp family divalent metal transporter [Geodermatophilus sp. YIM 151500]|uniref:Nramp family divalent metal transporter n=1 Tax=Geodermatophilus sp. YIM 151500 TaxID=2984531 RepID=UPI0021E3D016|nr:Nramp family divalent metal transporter [Geodermatophilus sp. YIM 151500]MCV2489244.1 Nramp family divalent metal transporter [Geodermatophilus sp. YIM 151500]